jgi:hypothetical protein
MRLERILPALACSALALTACTGSSNDPSGFWPPGRGPGGSLEFQLDTAPLAAASTPTISAVAVTVSRSGHATVERDLAVANGVATGRVDGLAPGYWHVEVQVYDAATQIFTGSTDVNVIAGVTVQCQILFDPVVDPPTTGSVTFTVGMNPMPGYTAINQTVAEILFDRPSRKLYVRDGTTGLIGVYDADTLVRIEDLAVPGAPSAAALNAAGTTIYLGYASGHVRALDVATGEHELVTDVLMQVQGLVPLDPPFLMVMGSGSYYAPVKVVDVATGQVVSTRSPFYSLTEGVYNATAKTVYAHHQGVSPTDIHYFKLDGTGAMLSDGDSVYHGDYYFGRPLRLLKEGARLATSSGGMFTSAELVANDLRYAGSLGFTYVDLAADDELGKVYLLNSAGLTKLVVIDQETWFVDLTVDLAGSPARVFETPTSIVVFATKDARTYARSFSKAALGL